MFYAHPLRRRWLTGALTGAVLFGVAACGYGRYGHGHYGHGFDRLAGRLELTDVQKSTLADAIAARQRTLQSASDRLLGAFERLAVLSGSAAAPLAERQAALDELAAAQRELAAVWFDVHDELVAQLTPEQLAELDQANARTVEHVQEHRRELADRMAHLDAWLDHTLR